MLCITCGCKYHPPNSLDIGGVEWKKQVWHVTWIFFNILVLRFFINVNKNLHTYNPDLYIYISKNYNILKISRQGNEIYKIFKETKTFQFMQRSIQYFFYAYLKLIKVHISYWKIITSVTSINNIPNICNKSHFQQICRSRKKLHVFWRK